MFPLFPPLRQRRAHIATLDREQAALEACAHEGADIELRRIELDGQPFLKTYPNIPISE